MFHRSFSFTLALGVFLAGSTFLLAAPAVADSTPAVSAKETPWFPTVEFGGKVGSKRHVWEMDATLPLLQDEDSLVFLDLRGRMDDDGSEEANLGIGWRRMVHGGEGIFGLYGFYDILHSSFNNTYNQGTLGAEYLWRNVEVRGNAYLPERGVRSTPGGGASGANIVGNQIFVMAGGGEEALPGFDIEAGLLVPGTEDLWLRAGLFHFSADDDLENVTGPRLSAEWGIDLGQFFRGTELTLGGEWQDDDIRGSQSFATARVRIPLGPAPSTRSQAPSWQYTRMQEKIRRDIDIVVAQGGGASVPALDPDTGEELDNVYFADADGDTDNEGTFEDPTDLYTALDLAGEDGIVVALGDAGDLSFYDVTVPDGGTLLGGGATLMVSAGGAETALVLPGARPNLVSDAGIELDADGGEILLKGFDLESEGDGIRGEYNYDVIIDDVRVVAGGEGEEEGGNAIDLDYASGSITVTNSTLDAGEYGIYVMPDYEGSVDVVIQDNVINAYRGVSLSASSSGDITALIEGNTLNTSNDGIRGNANYGGTIDLVIRDNVITAESDGIELDASSSASVQAEIVGNTIMADDVGIEADADYMYASIDLMIEDNVIIAEDGIELSASSEYSSSVSITAEIRDNTIDAEETGIRVYAYGNGASVDALIEDNTIEAEEGVDVSASYSGGVDAEVVGNSIDATENGVYVYAGYEGQVDVLIEDNVIAAYNGVYVSASSSSASAEVDIVDNEITASGDGIDGYAYYEATVDLLIEDNVIDAGGIGVYLSAAGSSSSSSSYSPGYIEADITGNDIDADSDGISLRGQVTVNACPPTLNALNGGASVSISGDVEDGEGSCED